jgi:hypothetical protein
MLMQLALAVDFFVFGSAISLSFLLAVHLYEKTGVPSKAANSVVLYEILKNATP